MATTILRRDRFARLDRPRAQLVAALAIGWAPLVLLGFIGRAVTGRVEPLVADVSVHVRLLVAVPLFLVADLLLAHQSRLTLRRLVEEGFVADEERPRFDRLLRSGERLRAAATPEVILLAVALAVGIATLAGWLSPTGMMRGRSDAGLGAARVWFGLVGLPLFVFVFGRSLWRWAIWVRVLVGLARLQLRLAFGHPDRRTGLGFLTLPSLAFHGPFLLAMSSVLCAGWGMQVVTAGAQLRQFRNPLIGFVVLGELLAFAPLLAFTPRLLVAARASLVEYGGLATEYARRFRRRWLMAASRDELLGTADVQTLNDLGGVFRESVQKTVPIVFGPRQLVLLLAVMLVPTLPLLLVFLPVAAVLGKLAHLLLGAG